MPTPVILDILTFLFIFLWPFAFILLPFLTQISELWKSHKKYVLALSLSQVEENPLRPVAHVYEEQMTLIRGELGPGSTDLEEFEGLVPNFASFAASLYRCGSCCWCWCCWWCWRWPPSWWLKRSSYHHSAGAPPASLQRLLTKLTLKSTQGSFYNHHDLCNSILSSSDSPATLRDN